MPFYDLNVPYSSDAAEFSHTLAFYDELGYNTLAISTQIVGKLPATPQTVPLSSLSAPKSITLLSRLTLTISDTSQNHRLASLQPHYDVIALRPTTEKALALCCGSLECDLISIDLTQRLPFILKFKTVASALQRGVRFEICYSPGIGGGNDARRSLISGATALIRATRGRGIVISSEARSALGVRGPWDVINLAQVWGLGQERGKEAVCEEARKVVALAHIKRTSFRGVVDVIEGAVHRPEQAQEQGQQNRKKGEGKLNAAKAQASASEESAVPIVAVGIKRKASSTSINAPPQSNSSITTEEKPLSKREMKRRAKKARLEGASGSGVAGAAVAAQDRANGFDIKHETLSSKKKT